MVMMSLMMVMMMSLKNGNMVTDANTHDGR